MRVLAGSSRAPFRAKSEEADFRGDVILTPNGCARLNIDISRTRRADDRNILRSRR